MRNGEALTILSDEGEYYKVRWAGADAYVKRENLKQGDKPRSTLLQDLRDRKETVFKGAGYHICNFCSCS